MAVLQLPCGTFRKHITKPSEQVAAPDCIRFPLTDWSQCPSSLAVLGAIVGLLCVLRRYADLIQSRTGVYGDYVNGGCDGTGDPDQLLLIYATKDNFEEDMKECQDMLNV